MYYCIMNNGCIGGPILRNHPMAIFSYKGGHLQITMARRPMPAGAPSCGGWGWT